MAYDPQAALMMASGGLNAGGGTGYAPSILGNQGAMGATGTPNATGTNLWDLPLLNTIPGMDWTTQSEGPQVYQPSFPTTPIPNVTPPTAANTGGVTPTSSPIPENFMTATDPWNWEYSGGDWGYSKRVRPVGDVSNYQKWYASTQKAIEENDRLYPWMANIPGLKEKRDLSKYGTPTEPYATPPLNWDLIKGPGQAFQQPGGVTQTIQANKLPDWRDYVAENPVRYIGDFEANQNPVIYGRS